MGTSPDWLGLERKIQAGKLIEQAAQEMGIPVETVYGWLNAKAEARKLDDDATRLTAAYALRTGIRKLTQLAKGKERLSSESTDGASSTSYESVDLKAAQTLVRIGLELKKLTRVPKEKAPGPPGSGGPDLFDSGPWSFKKPD